MSADCLGDRSPDVSRAERNLQVLKNNNKKTGPSRSHGDDADLRSCVVMKVEMDVPGSIPVPNGLWT